MKIRIIAVGKISSKSLQELVKDYQARLKHYVELEVIEVSESTRDDLQEEAGFIRQAMLDSAKTYALAIEGKALSSTELAQMIDQHQTYENTALQFIIGGSNGLDDSLKKQSISFSKLTFPHQIMRLILLEQLYRSYKILRHEPYHK